MRNQNLFEALQRICNYTALETEMDEIIEVVEKDNWAFLNENLNDNQDDFDCCSDCDLPDACSDFGCAIKQGIARKII